MSYVSLGGIPNFNMPSTLPVEGPGEASGASFSNVLKSAVDTVNTLHDDASSQVSSMLKGGTGDINNVMIAVEKADVSFQLMMQVRNKIVSAYQDIEKMQF
ncbi:MAG TPA: flagellar hook-basal body complex protein FliE [Terracidiphilus sp.]|jgi:flagellar hook-basal body complex protein FliE